MSDEERWEKQGAALFQQAREVEVAPPPAALARVKGGVRDRVERGRSFGLVPRLAIAGALSLLAVAGVMFKRADSGPRVTVVDGSLSTASGPLQAGDRIATGLELSTSSAGAVLSLGENARVELAAKSWARVVSPSHLELETGRVKLHVTRGPFHVSAAGVLLEVMGTVFEVACDRDEVKLLVSEGVVRVNRGADHWDVRAGEVWPQVAITDPDPRPEPVPEVAARPAPAPEQLSRLEQAVELTRRGKLDAARAIYAELSKDDAPIAELALYHLAHLEAQRAHRPKVALDVLDELLRRFPDGALSREAKLSRVEAEQALKKAP